MPLVLPVIGVLGGGRQVGIPESSTQQSYFSAQSSHQTWVAKNRVRVSGVD